MTGKPTTERLAEALEAAGAPRLMIERAMAGYYDDFKSPLATPIMQLVADCRKAKLDAIATRAMNGEFDSTREEAESWRQSDEGREMIKDLISKKPG